MQSPETAPLDSRERKPRRLWLIILIGCVALVLLFACWLLFERHRAKSALAKYEKELLAKGEKFTFAELIPPFPEGENAAVEFVRLSKSLQAGSTLTLNSPPSMKLVAPGKSLVIVKQAGWSAAGTRKAFTWDDASADLKKNADTLAQLREILRSPILRSVINYRGYSTLLPHLASSKTAAQWLSASSLYNLHSGNITEAIDEIESIVLINQVSADEPILISQLVRIAIATIAVGNCWPILQDNKVSEEQLARLQKILHDIDLASSMAQAFRGERLMGRDAIHRLRSTETDFQKAIDAFSAVSEDAEESSAIENLPYNDEIRDVIRAAIIVPMWRFVWSYEDERRLLEEVQALVEATLAAKAQRSASPVNIAAKRIQDRRGQSWNYMATDLFVGAIANGPLRAFRFHAQNELTITATALKRYYLRHGKYPRNLDELVPGFLATHPVDWMDGQKLRYRPEGDSFVLWSVGDNGTDDGGIPDQTEPYNFLNGPDIVWPLPASDAEVEAHKTKIRPKR